MSNGLLSRRDREVLSHLEFSPSLSAQVVAKKAKQKVTTTNYLLRRLWDEGVIAQRAFVNPYALGYTEVALYFSLTEQTRSARDKLFSRIIAHRRVMFFGGLVGDFHYVVVLLCRSLHEVNHLLHEIFRESGDVFSERLIAPRISSTRFSRKYFNPKNLSEVTVCASPVSEEVAIDSLDRSILHSVSNSRFESIRMVAREIGAPCSTVERRIERLTKNGVIRGFYMEISEECLGVQSFRILLSRKGICSPADSRLLEFCTKHPNVVYLIESLGAWDFEIGVEVESSLEITQLIEELHGVFGSKVGWTKALMESQSFKCSRFPFEGKES